MLWGMPGVTNTSQLSGMSRVSMSVMHYSLYVTIFLCFGEFQIAPIESIS
jgi:hypothetical protein